MSGAHGSSPVIESLRDRRDLTSGVTARLGQPAWYTRYNSDDLDKETVDALIREGEGFVPWLTGVLRSLCAEFSV